MNFDELHDLTLEKIEVDWEKCICRISIKGHRFCRHININNFLELVLPRQQPWGPSSSINRASNSGQKLEIEMQSGDVLSFRGEIQVIQLLIDDQVSPQEGTKA